MAVLDRELFVESLRDALNHLYEAEHLRHNVLAVTIGVANRLDTSSQLRNILINAIEEMKPDSANPSTEKAWRMYETLFYCYVQRLSQQAVADQISLSTRHLRREQKAALELLADSLCQRYDFRNQVIPEPETMSAELNESTLILSADPGSGYADLDWLKTEVTQQPTELRTELQTILSLIEPLARENGVILPVQFPNEPPPPIAVNPQAFQQIMLNLLGILIPVSEEIVQIKLAQDQNLFRMDILTNVTETLEIFKKDELDVIQYMVSLCKGSLGILIDEGMCSVTLHLPFIDQVTVMVVDDNPDTLRLFERYAAGTRYRMVGLRDPLQAHSLAVQIKPQVILLDVMMPGMDGWKILGRLRQHPKTEQIAVVICTIFPQERLALSLGASGFLKKPVSRQDLLDQLDRQIGLIDPTAHQASSRS